MKVSTEALGRHPLAVNTFRSGSEVNAVIETPRGSCLNYKYDEEHGLFVVHKVLTAGAVFPLDFGFLPSTRGDDGDPLDVLVLIEEPVSVGCLLPTRLIGVISADQTEAGKTRRNDRLIGVSTASHRYRKIESFQDVNAKLLGEIEQFFVFYNDAQGRKFKARGRHGANRTLKLVREGQARFQESKRAA